MCTSKYNNHALNAIEFLDIVSSFKLKSYSLTSSGASAVDPLVLAWALSLILNKTIFFNDESARHVYYSFESAHPYDASNDQSVLIEIPFATHLQINFDSRCRFDRSDDVLQLVEGDVDLGRGSTNSSTSSSVLCLK